MCTSGFSTPDKLFEMLNLTSDNVWLWVHVTLTLTLFGYARIALIPLPAPL